MKRREIIKKLGLGTALLPFATTLAAGTEDELPSGNPITNASPEDEKAWKKFARQHYRVSGEFINLENGYFGVQPEVVKEAYMDNIRKVNEYSSQYMRTSFNDDYQKIVEGLAQFSGVDAGEILITRNATEAMNIIIQGLNLQHGDEVVLHRQDYFSMIETFEMLAATKGIKVRYIKIPLVPENDEEILDAYRAAINSNTKCILVTHLLHMTGQIMPVKKIADEFRPRGVEVIVDAAHSYAQLDFKLTDLGVDFIGVNLHKWFSNPLGVGMLYVKSSRIKDLQPMFGDSRKKPGDIRKLGHFGTLATPILLTIPTARAYNEMVTLPIKECRLRYLQHYWTSRANKIDRVQVTTPTDSTRSCALASFKITGQDAKETVRMLHEQFKVFTVIRYLEDDQVVRVTPNLYNNTGDMNRLLEGLSVLSKV